MENINQKCPYVKKGCVNHGKCELCRVRHEIEGNLPGSMCNKDERQEMVKNNTTCKCPNIKCRRHGDCEACNKKHDGKRMYCATKEGSFRKKIIDTFFPLSALQMVLYIFALGLFGLSIFYWIRMISQNLWSELGYRIIIMILTIGTVICFVLARVLRKQAKILWKLEEKRDDKER